MPGVETGRAGGAGALTTGGGGTGAVVAAGVGTTRCRTGRRRSTRSTGFGGRDRRDGARRAAGGASGRRRGRLTSALETEAACGGRTGRADDELPKSACIPTAPTPRNARPATATSILGPL